MKVDFREIFQREIAKRHRTEWGSWKYHSNNFTLEFRDGRSFIYEIDLERCRTSAEVLDWIFQIHGKTWATAEVLKNLLDAFDDLLAPQANLCSFGAGSSIDPREILSSRKE